MKKIVTNDNLKTIVHVFVLFILTCLINFYLVNKFAFSSVPGIHENYRYLLSASTKLAAISIMVLSFYSSINFNIRFNIKLFITIIIYLFTNYFILITRNLNNKSFNILDFQGNDFFQFSGMKIVFFITFGSLILYLFFKIINLQKFINLFQFNIESNRINFLIGLIISLLLFKHNNIGVFLRSKVPDLTDFNIQSYQNYIMDVGILICVLTIITVIVVIVLLRAFAHIKKLNSSLSLAFITSLFIALFLNYCFQYGVKTDVDLLGQFVFPGATSFQIIVLFLLIFSIYVFTNRYLASTLTVLTLGLALAITNILKEKMRSEPLLISDFIWLKELSTVLSFVDKKIMIYIVLAVLLPIIIYFTIKRFVKVTPIISKLSYRMTLIIMLFATGFGVHFVFSHEKDGKIANNIPILSDVNNWYDIKWMGPDVNARYKSLTYVWIKQLTKRIMTEPKGYSKTKIKKIVEKYNKIADNINKGRTNNIDSQTVIYILSESFSNPNKLDNINVSKNVIPSIEKIESETTSGTMKSDGYGGGTANMEYQTLTGLPYYNFSPSVSSLYTEVVPKMKEFPSISNHFESKNRIVMHPSGAKNYSRQSIYEKLDFSRFIFSFDSKEKFKNPENKGVSMSDQSLYNNIIDNVKKSRNNEFYSIITMQNHVPWSVGEPTEINGSIPGMNNDENQNFTEYLRLLSYTDIYTKQFLDALSKVDKKVTVVFYGDHLPGLYPDSVFKQNPKKKYKTEYFIWSNYQTKKLNYPFVNSSDFSAELLEHTNSRVTPYYALLTNVLQESSIDKENLSNEGKIIANDLKLIQYDITLGGNYSTRMNFFKNKLGDK